MLLHPSTVRTHGLPLATPYGASRCRAVALSRRRAVAATCSFARHRFRPQRTPTTAYRPWEPRPAGRGVRRTRPRDPRRHLRRRAVAATCSFARHRFCPQRTPTTAFRPWEPRPAGRGGCALAPSGDRRGRDHVLRHGLCRGRHCRHSPPSLSSETSRPHPQLQRRPPGGEPRGDDRVGSFAGRRRDHSPGGRGTSSLTLVSFSVLMSNALSSFFFFCARRLIHRGASLVPTSVRREDRRRLVPRPRRGRLGSATFALSRFSGRIADDLSFDLGAVQICFGFTVLQRSCSRCSLGEFPTTCPLTSGRGERWQMRKEKVRVEF